MKRFIFGIIIGIVGVLALVLIRLPSVQETSQTDSFYDPYGSRYLYDFQNEFEPLAPLVVDKKTPALSSLSLGDPGADGLGAFLLPGEAVSHLWDRVANQQEKEKELYKKPDLPGTGFSVFTDIKLNIPDTIYNFPSPEQELGIPEPGSLGVGGKYFVLLDNVIKAHPLWVEVVRLDNDIEACKEQWRTYVDESVSTEEDIFQCLGEAEEVLGECTAVDSNKSPVLSGFSDVFEPGLAFIESSLSEEIRIRIETKRNEIKSSLEDKLYAERARLNNKFDKFKDRVIKETYVTVINIKMKLQLLDLSEDERVSLEKELESVNNIIEERLGSEQKALDDIYKEYEAWEIAAAEEELIRYENEQVAWMYSELEKERERLSKEIKNMFSGMDNNDLKIPDAWKEEVYRRRLIELSERYTKTSEEFKKKEIRFAEELEDLTSRREQAKERIMGDIRDAILNLEIGLGISIETVEDNLGYEENKFKNNDVTLDAIKEIQTYK